MYVCMTARSRSMTFGRRRNSRCTRTSCARWRASQSISTSLRAAVCDTVAIYFLCLVLVIHLGCQSEPSISFTSLETQSQPLRWSVDPLVVALAKTKGVSFGIMVGRLSINNSIANFVSGVSRISTFLFLLSVISTRSSLKI